MMRGGDKAAFGVLFDRYYDLLHTFARHIIKDSSVAEDIIQNVFVKMWMRKEQVNPEQMCIRDRPRTDSFSPRSRAISAYSFWARTLPVRSAAAVISGKRMVFKRK